MIKWIIFFIVLAVLIIGAIDEYVIRLNFGILYAYATESINLPLEPIQNINPTFRSDIVGIYLSKTSIALVKLNSTSIPSYEKLLELGYDKSKPISGKFIFKNGYLQREFTKVNNELVYYINNKNMTIIDPSEKLSKKIKMIIIEPSLKSYILHENMVKTDNTRIVHKDIAINITCTIATVSSYDILIRLPVIIKYLQNNCTGEFIEIRDIIKDATTKTDISTSQKYKEDKWKQETKANYKVSKIGTDKNINKSVTEDKEQKYRPSVHPPFNYTKYR